MKHWLFYGVLAAFLAGSIPARATPLDDKIAALKKAIQDEVAEKAKDNKPNGAFYPGGGFNPGAYLFQLNQFAGATSDPNQANQLQSTVQQIMATDTTDTVQKAATDVLDEIKSEQKARNDATTAEMEGVLDRARDAILKAKKPSDLDASLQELQKAQSSQNGMFVPGLQNYVQRLNGAYQFATAWQDYLSYLAAGQTDQASNSLRMLLQNNYGITVIPRSEILERMQDLGKTNTAGSAPAQSAADIFNNIKTLDEMEPALKRIQAMRPPMNIYGGYNGYNADTQQILNLLSQYVRVYDDVRAGIPSNFNLGFINGNQVTGNSELTARLLVFVMQHYFDTFQGAAPTADEKPQAFLKRVIDDAKTRQDWALLGKAGGMEQYFSQASGVPGYGAVAMTGAVGLDSLMAGLNQEEAGQYAQAVVSYQAALKSSSDLIPAKVIGDHLAAIQKDHPKEYDAGMQQAISPPFPRYYPGMVPGMVYPFGAGGIIYNQGGLPLSAPILTIPGETTNTPPAAPTEPPKATTTNTPAATSPSPKSPKPPGD